MIVEIHAESGNDAVRTLYQVLGAIETELAQYRIDIDKRIALRTSGTLPLRDENGNSFGRITIK